ncbi:aminotransferase class I/II-fold pyridoxal phosphate-dependent enzyme, partial [Streptomyces sp. NPDC001848]|uniref:aminotransferase class I/II-fold pyridoxal phosphate-dependent enzyme n=1 Tax=Streptomyces sp. NPDC001848 TaxID=3364618 RepID=UPI0036D08B5C
PDRVIATGTVSKSLAPDRVIATGTVSKSLAPDRVIATGTVSKSLAPALRIGRLVCPSAIVPLVAEHKHLSDRGSPILDQLALARLIESGRYDRHLRRMRARYAARRATLVAALARHAPGVRVTGAAAGFHLVAHLSAAADERAVVAGALQRSVGRYGMSACRASGHTAPAQLVLGFGNLGDDALTAAVAAVGGLLPGAGAGPEDGHAGRV